MPPKGKAKSKAPRAPKAAAKASTGSSMDDVLGDACTTAGSARKRRQLCRRDTEEKVRRCLSTHFADVPQAELSTKVVDGKNLVDTIKEDLKSGRSARLGKRYWEELQGRFVFEAAGATQISVKDSTQPVGDDLRLSLECALDASAAKRSLARLTALLQHRSDMNQREVCGLVLALTKIAAAGNARSAVDAVHIELAKLFVRLCWGVSGVCVG